MKTAKNGQKRKHRRRGIISKYLLIIINEVIGNHIMHVMNLSWKLGSA